MADVTIESAVREGDKVTVTGTGFTKTTTQVEIDGTPTAFEIPADVTDGTKLVVSDVDPEATEVTVIKGEIEQSLAISDSTTGSSAAGSGETAASGGSPEAPYPEQPTSEDELSDASPGQMAGAASAGAATAQNPAPVESGTYETKAHLEGKNVNEAVAGTKLDRIEEEWGIGPRDPYPVGSPPDPLVARQRMGLPPVKEGEDEPNRP
jgi:hypothetical protein